MAESNEKIVITGTGRAGTTFLVELLTELGLDTGFGPDRAPSYFPAARAGLEWHLHQPNLPAILKGPHFCEQIDDILARGFRIAHVIVPVRNFAAAAASRALVQNETAGAEAGRLVAGGFWDARSASEQTDVLHRKFAALMEAVARHDLPLTLLSFPRLARDPGYLHAKLMRVFPDLDAARFRAVFARLARPELIHDFAPTGVPDAPRLSVPVSKPASGGYMPTAPSFLDRYKKVIVEALQHSYVGLSSSNATPTGNSYQTVDLGDVRVVGGRPARDLFVQHLDLAGKTVLDIGANLGEISRLARANGAALVDGYEYDPFFVETGRFINAATGATRVSLFQGDATDPALYAGMSYDIVFAFSVYVYIEKVLPAVAAAADVLVLETHTLDHGLGMYVDRMMPHFPHWRLLGFSDMNANRSKSRAVIVFGKTADAVRRTLALQTLRPENYFPHNFFERWGRPEGGEGFATWLDAFRQRVPADEDLNGFGVQYLAAFLAGYAEYAEAGGELAAGNAFLRKYRRAIESGAIDAGLKPLLADDGLLCAKVMGKFGDLDHARAGRWHRIAPITLTATEDGKLRFKTTAGAEIRAFNIDGHHRFFIHQLFGREVDCLVRQQPATDKPVIKARYTLTPAKAG